jgi:hypothetical protein
MVIEWDMETKKGRWANHPHVTLSCAICQAPFTVTEYRAKVGAKYCGYKCHQIGEGRKGGALTGALMKSRSQGKSYIKKNGRHLHRQVMEKKIGRALTKGEIVHHRDGNKLNNRPSNLQLLPSQAAHVILHAKERKTSRSPAV